MLVELFCGAGGLSIGLMEEGFRPALSVDNNSNSLETHKAYFPGAAVNQDLGIFDVVDYLTEPFLDVEVSLLAGGPPCQPFSTYAQRYELDGKDGKWGLLYEFARLAKGTKPDVITMENVPTVAKHEVFQDFVDNGGGINVILFRVIGNWQAVTKAAIDHGFDIIFIHFGFALKPGMGAHRTIQRQ